MSVTLESLAKELDKANEARGRIRAKWEKRGKSLAEAYARIGTLKARVAELEKGGPSYFPTFTIQDVVKIKSMLSEGLVAERNAAKKETTLLRQAIGLATTAVPSMEVNVDDPVGMLRRVVDRVAELEEQLESVACRAATAENRVAELEANANTATILAKIRESEWSMASELAAEANAESSAAPAASGNVEKKPMKIPSREWFERMVSVDDSEVSVGGLASRVTELESSAPAASGAAGTELVGSEVVGYAVKQGKFYSERLHSNYGDAWGVAGKGTVVPLYAAPQPASNWLTEEERSMLLSLADGYERRASRIDKMTQPSMTIGSGLPTAIDCRSDAAMLRSILARSTPPEVVLTEVFNHFDTYGDRVASFDADRVRKALAAAGVPWKEVSDG